MRLPALLFGGLVFIAAREARAADANDQAWSTPFVVGARLEGLPLPFEGFNGLTLEVAPTRFVSVEVGGGVWFYGPAALSTLHLQIPIGRAGLGLEAGFLTGSFSIGDDCQYDVVGAEGCAADDTVNRRGHTLGLQVRDAVFARVGPSFSWRSRSGGFQLRAFVGATTLVTRGVGISVDEVTGREQRGGFVVDSRTLPTLLYAGVSLGYGFRM